MADFQKVISHLIARLKATGFIIQRYDAYSTQSVYLKLDYGVCNSIRISDHPGKAHLSYRYNLIKGVDVHSDFGDDGLLRHYFPHDRVDNLVTKILSDRENRLATYGIPKYTALMKKNREKHKNDRGFWKEARLV